MQSRLELAADICIVGGGPAGSMTALGLARSGHRVIIVNDAVGGQTGLECLPPSVWPVLEALGVRSRIQAARFTPCALTRLRWSSPREEQRITLGSLLVQRARLDAILLDAARDAGVRVMPGGHAVRPDWDGSSWHMGGVRARFLVDAAGRRGCLPRRRQRLSAPLIALTGTWSGGLLDAPAEMRVEGLRNGWCWAATSGDSVWEVSVFFDAAVCAGLDRAGRTAAYRAAVAGSTLLAGFRQAAEPIRIRDASAWVTDKVMTRRAIRVGDAALARDPLSSQGIQSALRVAPWAAAAVDTILSGGDTDSAIAGYEAAYHDSANHHATIAATFYAAGGWRDASFWRQRSDPWRAGVNAGAKPGQDGRDQQHSCYRTQSSGYAA
jgi:flavin-dependent dehydrogenase